MQFFCYLWWTWWSKLCWIFKG